MGHFHKARQLLDEMPEPNIVSYNSLFSGLNHHGLYSELVTLFIRMQNQYSCVFMDEFTLVSLVGACACLSATKLLCQLHGVALLIGMRFNIVVCNALIDAYGKCDEPDKSYQLFSRMPERDVVSWTSMVVAYARASRLVDACTVFNQIPVKNTVSWTALIAGFAQNGQGGEALDLFSQMLEEGVLPSSFTYVAVLSACADQALIETGKQLHGCIIRRSSVRETFNVFLCNALINMYSKCGGMKPASALFERLHWKDIISWNSIIIGLAQNGHGEESLAMFKRMIDAKIKPNHVTFLGVLSACSHVGLIHEGLRILYLMEDFGVTPRLDHYSVLIDLLGRINRLEEALDFIVKAPKGSDHVRIWGALLGGCRVHGNLDIGRRAAEALFKLEPNNTARYVMLSNLYAAAGRWDDASRVRRLIADRGLRKEAGYSWIEIRHTRHVFVAKDTTHCQIEQIYESIHKLVDLMSDAGYLPCTENSIFPGDKEIC
ncbi:hypothetical protein RJ640_008227 [Escallonia rubra]|uniref:Pentatricopeptide repeat-containing protein n=1 Tax=Escallonia rubra TaxID=112253 RepID=A0AA88Q9Q3_9ASTE|nr:hypothetical protein RJ640_008227 [Escallonia rubra]